MVVSTRRSYRQQNTDFLSFLVISSWVKDALSCGEATGTVYNFSRRPLAKYYENYELAIKELEVDEDTGKTKKEDIIDSLAQLFVEHENIILRDSTDLNLQSFDINKKEIALPIGARFSAMLRLCLSLIHIRRYLIQAGVKNEYLSNLKLKSEIGKRYLKVMSTLFIVETDNDVFMKEMCTDSNSCELTKNLQELFYAVEGDKALLLPLLCALTTIRKLIGFVGIIMGIYYFYIPTRLCIEFQSGIVESNLRTLTHSNNFNGYFFNNVFVPSWEHYVNMRIPALIPDDDDSLRRVVFGAIIFCGTTAFNNQAKSMCSFSREANVDNIEHDCSPFWKQPVCFIDFEQISSKKLAFGIIPRAISGICNMTSLRYPLEEGNSAHSKREKFCTAHSTTLIKLFFSILFVQNSRFVDPSTLEGDARSTDQRLQEFSYPEFEYFVYLFLHHLRQYGGEVPWNLMADTLNTLNSHHYFDFQVLNIVCNIMKGLAGNTILSPNAETAFLSNPECLNRIISRDVAIFYSCGLNTLSISLTADILTPILLFMHNLRSKISFKPSNHLYSNFGIFDPSSQHNFSEEANLVPFWENNCYVKPTLYLGKGAAAVLDEINEVTCSFAAIKPIYGVLKRNCFVELAVSQGMSFKLNYFPPIQGIISELSYNINNITSLCSDPLQGLRISNRALSIAYESTLSISLHAIPSLYNRDEMPWLHNFLRTTNFSKRCVYDDRVAIQLVLLAVVCGTQLNALGSTNEVKNVFGTRGVYAALYYLVKDMENLKGSNFKSLPNSYHLPCSPVPFSIMSRIAKESGCAQEEVLSGVPFKCLFRYEQLPAPLRHSFLQLCNCEMDNHTPYVYSPMLQLFSNLFSTHLPDRDATNGGDEVFINAPSFKMMDSLAGDNSQMQILRNKLSGCIGPYTLAMERFMTHFAFQIFDYEVHNYILSPLRELCRAWNDMQKLYVEKQRELNVIYHNTESVDSQEGSNDTNVVANTETLEGTIPIERANFQTYMNTNESLSSYSDYNLHHGSWHPSIFPPLEALTTFEAFEVAYNSSIEHFISIWHKIVQRNFIFCSSPVDILLLLVFYGKNIRLDCICDVPTMSTASRNFTENSELYDWAVQNQGSRPPANKEEWNHVTESISFNKVSPYFNDVIFEQDLPYVVFMRNVLFRLLDMLNECVTLLVAIAITIVSADDEYGPVRSLKDIRVDSSRIIPLELRLNCLQVLHILSLTGILHSKGPYATFLKKKYVFLFEYLSPFENKSRNTRLSGLAVPENIV